MIRAKIEQQDVAEDRGSASPSASGVYRVQDIPGHREPVVLDSLVSSSGRTLERRDPATYPEAPTKK